MPRSGHSGNPEWWWLEKVEKEMRETEATMQMAMKPFMVYLDEFEGCIEQCRRSMVFKGFWWVVTDRFLVFDP